MKSDNNATTSNLHPLQMVGVEVRVGEGVGTGVMIRTGAGVCHTYLTLHLCCTYLGMYSTGR